MESLEVMCLAQKSDAGSIIMLGEIRQTDLALAVRALGTRLMEE
jgi:hypothetical protein